MDALRHQRLSRGTTVTAAMVERLEQAAELLEAAALSIAGRVHAEREERERLDLTGTAYQRRLERGQQE
jgi:hypothetical protein